MTGCTGTAKPDASPAGTGGSTSGNAGAAATTGGSGANAMGGSNPSGGGSGGVETPGTDPSQCAGLPPEEVFALSSGSAVTAAGPFVVLTGTLPPDINGNPIAAVEVQGSTRGVRIDSERKVWTYFLAGPAGDVSVTASAEAGGSAGPLSAAITLGDAPLPDRSIVDGERSVGAWMFTWFTGDPSWDCSSAWRPVGGFETWDGSVAWAREQLLDQIDAHIDVIGLQLDTASGAGNQGYRFTNIVNVMEAARDLLEEGVLPPRLFPFLDTAIISNHYQTSQGGTLDLSGAAGRAYFYGHAQAFYQAAEMAFGSRSLAAGTARFQAGLPAVGAWHSESMTGVDNAAVLDFKARFTADFGSACYFIAHPNDWRDFEAVDEITQMVGPPEHFLKVGRDGGGFPTINVEAGFWNPTSNTFYLPREGGTHFDQAWQSAQAEREAARHIWIDTWNETGEGSGIFAAEPLTYTANDAGPCGDFVNRHVESWGPSGRHYIDVTRAQASAWNDAPDFDAAPVASDVPSSMKPGEQRYVTVVMRNTGDITWQPQGQQLGLSSAAAAADFHVAASAVAQTDELSSRFGGIARGLPGVFTVLLTAPCAAGTHQLSLEMYDAQAGRFGTAFTQDVTVAP